MIDSGFLAITITLCAVVLGSLATWLHARKQNRPITKVYYIVPIVIISLIILILMQKTLWDVDSTNMRYERRKEQLLAAKWDMVETQLGKLQEENFTLARQMADQIAAQLSSYDAATLDDHLAALPSENNIIQEATDQVLRGVHFRDIINDANDPFAILVGKGAEDSFIFSDFSENCALPDSGQVTKSLQQEYALVEVQGNRVLTEKALTSIIGVEPGTPLPDTIFLQFAGRETPLQPPYTLKGLEELFVSLEGSVHKTFEALEFCAPYYIYRDQAISGTPRVVSHIKTDAKIIAVVSIFNYLDVLSQDAYMSMQLDRFDKELSLANYERILEERSTLIIGLLIMAVIFVLLILFWVFMQFSYEDPYL
jgi:uncharacterized membrane protein